jgi:thiol:disulfide interchange protein DsbD
MESTLAGYVHNAPLLALVLAFVGGVVTSFTPCVYPVIPITVTYIGARSIQSRAHAFFLSLLYALGMAVIYAGLGMFAALTGKLFGAITQNPYLYLAVGNVILLFGLNMLEVFSLPIPRFLSKARGDKGQKGFTGAFFLGMTSGLIVGPCTAPVLATILTYVSTQKNVFLGGSMLFLFAMGMSTLLVVLGTFSGLLSSLPKSGAWMVKVKKGFGWVMVALGEYFILKAGMYW